MCGIVGFAGELSSCLGKYGLVNMLNAIKHRGPDEEGMYYNKNIGLGIRRLSIVDIKDGQQPVNNESRDIFVVFNGEIYNYKSLKQLLIKKGHSFHSNSDTEVIVHLYEEYEESFIRYIEGMFAIAIWDSRRNKLILIRDRMGIKPLYYLIKNDTLFFASEIKALLSCGIIEAEVNTSLLGSYLTYRFIPGEQTMFKNIFKLMPGNIIIYESGRIVKKKYWDINVEGSFVSSGYEECLKGIKGIFSQSIKCRIGDEKRVGVFLSGGLDSTIVLSEVSKHCSDIDTFSVCFEKPKLCSDKMEYDEICYSEKVAALYATNHHMYTIGIREVVDDIEKIIGFMDEPISDPTSIPLYYVAKLAKDKCKVIFSGEGADEIFGGYSIYKEPEAINRYLKIPAAVRKNIIEKLLLSSPVKWGKDFINRANNAVEKRYKGVGLTFRGEEVMQILDGDLRQCMIDENIEAYIRDVFNGCSNLNEAEKMMYFDQKVWLPEDVLVKTDKMSMAHSIELRVPFLDHRLVNYSLKIPFPLKYKNNTEKYILKESFKDQIPEFVLHRKKTGFPVPISALLNKEFKEFAYDTLLSQRFTERGYFNMNFIRQLLNKNSLNNPYIGRQIWLLITFELWHRVFID